MYYNSLPYRIALNSCRKEAKHQFSKLYKKAIRKGRPKQKAITNASSWLNHQIGIVIDYETMKDVTINRCKEIIKTIELYVRKYR